MKLLSAAAAAGLVLLWGTPVLDQTAQAAAGKISTGAYAYKEDGLTGQLELIANREKPGNYYATINTVNGETGDTCDFEGECVFKDGKLICTDDMVKEDPDNYIEIVPKARDNLEITKQFMGVCGMRGYIIGNYAPACLDKVLETKTVTGTYLGWFEAEEGFHTIGLRPESGEDMYLVASEEDAQKLFGEPTEQKVSVTYDVEQMPYFNQCEKIAFLKSGQVLK